MTQNLAPFAAVGALINQGVSQLLSNATATWQGGEPFGVVFDKGGRDALGVATGFSSCGFQSSCAPGLDQGGVLAIDGTDYEVAEPVQPDASGWVVLQLRLKGED